MELNFDLKKQSILPFLTSVKEVKFIAFLHMSPQNIRGGGHIAFGADLLASALALV